jgi:hypothetical protein
VWVEDWAYLRAASEFYLFGAAIVLGSRRKIQIPVFAGWLALWVFYFVWRAH